MSISFHLSSAILKIEASNVPAARRRADVKQLEKMLAVYKENFDSVDRDAHMRPKLKAYYDEVYHSKRTPPKTSGLEADCYRCGIMESNVFGESYGSFTARLFDAQRLMPRFEMSNCQFPGPLPVGSGRVISSAQNNGPIICKKRWARIENNGNGASWQEDQDILQEELNACHGDVLLDDGTVCDMVTKIDEDAYYTRTGKVVFHGQYRFKLHECPSFTAKDDETYNHPLYFRGRVHWMHAETNRPHSLSRKDAKLTIDQFRARYVKNAVSESELDTIYEAFIDQINWVTGQIRGGMSHSTSTANSAILERYLDLDNVLFSYLAFEHNPCYVFGFDRMAPVANYGFANPWFFVAEIEQYEWNVSPYETTSVRADRQHGVYTLVMGAMLGRPFTYRPCVDHT